MSSSSLPLWPEAESSFVGKSIHLEGSLRFRGDFLLDGHFSGEIEGSGRLEIGSSAQASGKIIADELIHYGRTEGDLIAVKKLDLRPGCLHRGDIQALRVRVSSRARLEGVLKMPDSSPASPPNSSFYRYRSHITVGIIVLLLAVAGATTAIGKLPKIWHSVEGPIKKFASLAQSLPRRSTPRVSSASIIQRQESFLGEALLRERERNFPESVVLLKKAIILGGRKSSLAQFRLAKILAQSGHYRDAIACLKVLLKEAPGHIGGMILLGDLHARAGRFQKAAFAYAEAVRHDPVDLVLRRRLERVRARTGGKRSDSGKKNIPSLDRILDDVELLLGKKKPVQAAKVIRNGLARLPNEPRLYFQLGSTLREIADRRGAIDAYRRVISLAPDWLDAYTRLGALLEASQRYKEAVALYKRAADLHPSNLDMLVQIPLLEKRRGRRDKAYRLLLKMKKDYPKSTIVLVELGMLLWESGKAGEARSVFRRVLELDPHSSPALNRLAWFHVVDGKNLERGIEYSKRSLEIRPDIPPYLDTLAELYYRNGQPVKSIPLIHRAIELEPSNRYYRVQLDKFKRAMR